MPRPERRTDAQRLSGTRVWARTESDNVHARLTIFQPSSPISYENAATSSLYLPYERDRFTARFDDAVLSCTKEIATGGRRGGFRRGLSWSSQGCGHRRARRINENRTTHGHCVKRDMRSSNVTYSVQMAARISLSIFLSRSGFLFANHHPDYAFDIGSEDIRARRAKSERVD